MIEALLSSLDIVSPSVGMAPVHYCEHRCIERHAKRQHLELSTQFYGNIITQIKVAAHCDALGLVCGIVCGGVRPE